MNIQIHIADDLLYQKKSNETPQVHVSSKQLNTDDNRQDIIHIDIGSNGQVDCSIDK